MNKYLKQSIVLHVAVAAAMLIDLPNFWRQDMTLGETPIIVDLSQVKIDEFTNLPTKAEFGPEDRKATVEEKKEQYTQDTEPEPEPQKVEDTPPEPEPEEEIKEDYVAEPTPVPEKKPEKKPDPKPTPKRPPVPSSKPKPKPKPQPKPDNNDKNKKQEEQAKIRSNALKSLLQEMDSNKDIDIGEKTQTAQIKEGTPVNNMGIEGGNSKGSYFSDLTISETAAIASLLSQNWKIDPGAIGIDGMLVEIRVHLQRDGSIKDINRDIEFVDKSRFNSDASYRSMAESAKRAIIDTREAFKEVFGRRHADSYDEWSTLRLKFDPLDKSVK